MTIGTESPIYRMINNTGSYGTSKKWEYPPWWSYKAHKVSKDNWGNRINVSDIYSGAYSSVFF